MAVLIHLRDLVKEYHRGAESLRVLDGLSLDIQAGEFVALMGPSGSGKSTLLNLLGGLDRPTAGTLAIGGLAVGELPDAALARWRADHVGFIFQMYNLLPVLSAERNVELPLLLTDLSGKERMRRARAALELVGLGHRLTHRPNELSGGQQQRVGIARAIVTDPTLLLCDEPTGDLRPSSWSRTTPKPPSGPVASCIWKRGDWSRRSAPPRPKRPESSSPRPAEPRRTTLPAPGSRPFPKRPREVCCVSRRVGLV